jgi:RNA polymerase sigma-70 factor (ECF subfamily)
MAPSGDPSEETTAGDGWFKTTHWSAVLLAGRRDSPQADAALAQLCQIYRSPLYVYVRRRGHNPEDAQDLTQSFFARLLERNYLEDVVREKGKFRSFLLMALKRFLANEWEKAGSQKRGGRVTILSLDQAMIETRYQANLLDQFTPEKAYDQRWAATLLEKTIDRLATEMTGANKKKLFDELRPFLSGEKDGSSYAETAQRLEMSEATLRVNIHRIRQRYRELLRLEIADTVDTPEAVEDEIRYLFSAGT